MFIKPSIPAVMHLKYIIQVFAIFSGMRINWDKSSIVGVNVIGTQVYADILRCKVESFPISYLGLPLGGQPHLCSFWDPVIMKVEKKLASWKRNYSSIGGRITLIRAVLCNLPTYFMSVFSMPVKVAKRIEQLQRSFLWNYGDSKPFLINGFGGSWWRKIICGGC